MPKLPGFVRLLALALSLFPAVCRAAEDLAESTVDLTPRVAAKDLAEVSVEMTVGGNLRVRQDQGKSAETKDLPMSVSATLKYDEFRTAPATGSNLSTRAIRYYDQADAVIKVESGGLTPKLADERRLVVVENPGGRLFLWSPRGLLEREELDLIDVTGDSLVIDELLPKEPVAKGATWPVDTTAIAGVLSLDSVASCEVQSTLDKFNADFALVRFAGGIVGTADGAPTEMDVRGVYLFDRRLHRITRFNLAVKEKRSIGGATPGLDSVAKLKLNVKPIATSEHLTDETLAELKAPKGVRLDMLRLDAAQQGFRVLHDRHWFLTSRERETLVLRRVDRNDVVAQCTITTLPAKSQGRQTTLDQFEKDIRYSLKDNFGQLISSRQWTNAYGHHCYEVVVRGNAEQVPVEWHYYLVAPESGNRVSIAITIDGNMVDRVAGADRALVNAIQLVPSAKRIAARAAASVDKSLIVTPK